MVLYIGNHTSSSKGYAAMGRQMLKNGGNTFAFFTRNPRGGSAKEIRQEDVDKFLKIAEEGEFGKLVAHAPYTLNACAAREEVRTFAREAFADDLRRMEYIPGNYYNFHPGSHVGQGTEEGIRLISEMLNENLKKEQTTTVLLETMAGKGTEVGRTFEELQSIMERVQLSDKLGVCLDTCHVWDAGYDIVNDLDGVLEEFDRVLIGLDFFDASINRVAAWVVGTRSAQKALLFALLQPDEKLRQLQDGANFTEKMVLMEEAKTLPFGDVWAEYCRRQGVPADGDWYAAVTQYEKEVLSRRG